MKSVAVIYHYFALYRLPIFKNLMQSKKVKYTLYSGLTSEFTISKIDSKLADFPIEGGGLRWKFVKNVWLLRKKFLWQSGVISVAFKGDYHAYIFLGSPYFLSTWIAACIVRLRGKRVYYWMHGIYKDQILFVDKIKLFVFYKLANGFFLYGHRAEGIINKFNIKPSKDVHVIYNSLDYSESFKFRKQFNLSNVSVFRNEYFQDVNTPVVIFIGRLNSIKKIDMLISAQENLRDKNSKIVFNLVIIGDGEMRNELEAQVLSSGLSNHVTFLGAIYDENINSYCLLNSDLCVTPGDVGLTCIHALSYGTPVISHNNLNIQMPEVEAIVSGLTGELYEYGSLESLSSCIERWLLKFPIKNKLIMENCYKIIDDKYNPIIQSQIFDSVLK